MKRDDLHSTRYIFHTLLRYMDVHSTSSITWVDTSFWRSQHGGDAHPNAKSGSFSHFVLLEIHVGNVDMGLCSVVSCDTVCGCFIQWWYPTTIGFPTKNDHFGVFLGYHHLRKHPYEYCADLVGWCLFQIDGACGGRYFLWGSMLGLVRKK